MCSSGSAIHSARQLIASRSCTVAMPSRASPAACLIGAVSAAAPSSSAGLRLCGIVVEPILPSANGSSTSAISVCIRDDSSVAILPRLAEISASSWAYSAIRSRDDCHEMVGTCSPSSSRVATSTSRPRSPRDAAVPTPPLMLPVSTRSATASSRSTCRSSSSSQIATLNPKVVGSACT